MSGFLWIGLVIKKSFYSKLRHRLEKKVRGLVKFFYGFLLYMLTPVAFVLKVFGVRVLNVKHEAIGHLAIEPDVYLREQKLKNAKQLTILFPPYRFLKDNKFLSSGVSNRFLLNCWKKYFLVIQNPFLHIILYPILKSPLLCYDPHRYLCPRLLNLYVGGDCVSIYNDYAKKYGDGKNYKSFLSLKKNEIEKGNRILMEMGLSANDWYVCFNCREAGCYSYYGLNAMSVRNAEIDSYDLAIKEIVARGGWCIRMGSPLTKELPASFKHERIIDYPHSKWVSEFMDVFLISRCLYFIGTNSGITCAAAVFGTPCVLTNAVPFGQFLFYPNHLAIFKTHRRKADQKLLSFSQCLTSLLSMSIFTKDYDELGIEVVDNTKEEIRDVCLEMLNRLEGRHQTTDREEKLQTKFQSLLNSFCLSRGSPSKIGKEFLNKYQDLLG